MSDEEDYDFDEMDALTAFLDEEEERNPYDHDDDDEVGDQVQLATHEGDSGESKPAGDFEEDEKDEERLLDEMKSKEELIEEICKLRKQIKELMEEKEKRKELFSKALSGSIDSPTLKRSIEKTRAGPRKKQNTPLQEPRKFQTPKEKTFPIRQNNSDMQFKSKASSDTKKKEEKETGINVTPEEKTFPIRQNNSDMQFKSKASSDTKKKEEKETGINVTPEDKQESEKVATAAGPGKNETSKKTFHEVESSDQDDKSNTEGTIEKENKNTSRGGIETAKEEISKKSFHDMFGSLEGSDDEEEPQSNEKHEREKKSRSPPSGKKEEPEDKSCNLAGGSNSFYQDTNKRVAHKSNNSPPNGNLSKSKGPQRPTIFSSGSHKTTKSLSTEDPWEVEYYSRIRISNPVVSMSALKVKMQQRKTLRLSILKRHVKGADMDGDWVTIGVIISKSTPKTSKTGKQFSIWKLNDLSTNCPIVALFLFGKSHEDHWKTVEGSVVGLLNAKVMPPKDGSDDVSLSVDNPQKLLILGKSKDLGWCKGTKKDGGRCTMFVNKAECDWCDYHIQTQYKKQCSKRTDLNTSFTGLNPTAAMKKATKNVFYQGKMYNATERIKPSKNPNKNIVMKKLGSIYANDIKEELKPKCVTLLGKVKLEDDTLVKVSGSTKKFHSLLSQPSPGSQNFIRHMVEAEKCKTIVVVPAADLLKQHQKDISSLIKSRKRTKDCTVVKDGNKENSPASHKKENQKEKEKELKTKCKQELLLEKLKKGMKSSQHRENIGEEGVGPVLGVNLQPGCDVDLSGEGDVVRMKESHRMTKEELAKAKAKAFVKRKGRIIKKNPNETQKTKKPLDERALIEIKKRSELNRKSSSDENGEEVQPQKKRRKVVLGEVIDIDSEEMQEVMAGSSFYKGALREIEAELEERYFNEMEQKEKLELKMDSIMEKEVKVVSCQHCKFTWFCPSSLCKAENHKLNWHNAVQRFFKCQGCGLRSISFYRYPTKHCRNCRGGKFTRVSMLNIREKKEETLLLRGEERRWLN